MPLLEDLDRGLVLPESTTIVEHLDRIAPRGPRLLPDDPDLARRPRARGPAVGRVFDHHGPMSSVRPGSAAVEVAQGALLAARAAADEVAQSGTTTHLL